MMLQPPVEPMLAKPLGFAIPEQLDDVQFEPKWDGFRALVFWDGESVVLQGRGRSSAPGTVVDLAYAFPELVAAVREQVAMGTVLDTEIVVAASGRLDFTALGQRLRPRSEAGGSGIARLAESTPASLLVFDLLFDGTDLMTSPLRERRARLAEVARSWHAPLVLTPATTDRSVAQHWFDAYESAGVDGLIVKGLADPYQPGVRAQGKVKHERTADVVVAGWRPHTKAGPDGADIVGSLLLGLYDESGVLQYVGVASAFSMAVRAQLRELLDPLAVASDEAHPWRDGDALRTPGTANRWRREQPWVALEPRLVAEVAYDQMLDGRFRHVARFLRWRPDRDATSCNFDQLQQPPAAAIERLITGIG